MTNPFFFKLTYGKGSVNKSIESRFSMELFIKENTHNLAFILHHIVTVKSKIFVKAVILC